MPRHIEKAPVPEEIPYVDFENLRLLETPIMGIQKRVQKATMPSGELVAVKMFYPEDTLLHKPVNQGALAREEFDAYRNLQTNPRIGIYVPVPVALVRENGETRGLAVSWKDGSSLRSLKRRYYIEHNELNTFRGALLSWQGPTFPMSVMLTDENLHYSKSGFWFSSCWLESSRQDKFKIDVDQALRKLSVDYVR